MNKTINMKNQKTNIDIDIQKEFNVIQYLLIFDLFMISVLFGIVVCILKCV